MTTAHPPPLAAGEPAQALQVILDTMSQGLLVLDAELRVVAYSRALLELMDLSPALLKSRPTVDALVRLTALRGDYGKLDVERFVAERVAQFRRAEPFRQEMRRPGGRIVELRPGDVFHVGPVPHDSWVVGDDFYVSLHFLGAESYAGRS